ncbi:MAG: DUF3617 family protein [Acidobacteriaceae bacterium]
MKRTVLATSALLFASAIFASAQSAPPLKMGLWEHTVTLDMSGMPSGMGGSGQPITKQSCMTSKTWKDTLQSMQSHRQMANAANCSTSNVQQDAHHFSFDVACSPQQGMNTKIHVDMTLDSEESMHGTTTTSISGPQFPQGMTMTAKIKSKFVSSDCGSVKPGEQTSTPPSGAPPS